MNFTNKRAGFDRFVKIHMNWPLRRRIKSKIISWTRENWKIMKSTKGRMDRVYFVFFVCLSK